MFIGTFSEFGVFYGALVMDTLLIAAVLIVVAALPAR